MDNVTHTLIGVAMGHGLNHLRAKSDASARTLRSATIWTAVIASNLPDLDFVLRWFLADHRLAYLVHHRGYTHTFLLLPLLGAISALCGLFAGGLSPRKSANWRAMGWAAGLGVFFHIAADFCNEYGVHPLFPFSNQWFYGDFVFILEPVFWLALLPMAITQSRSRFAWLVWGMLELALYYLIWTNGLATPATRIGLSVWGMVFAVWQWRRPGLAPAFIGMGIGLAVFLLSSVAARTLVFHELSAGRPDERVLQFATSPAPGNPIQWRLVLATVDARGDYRVRIGSLSFLPGLRLPEGFPGPGYVTTAPLGPSTLSSSDRIHWQGEFRRPMAELRPLTERFCRLKALLRFTRMPFWLPSGDGLIAGDLRYDREPGLGFTEFYMEASDSCLPSEPPWNPPISP